MVDSSSRNIFFLVSGKGFQGACNCYVDAVFLEVGYLPICLFLGLIALRWMSLWTLIWVFDAETEHYDTI